MMKYGFALVVVLSAACGGGDKGGGSLPDGPPGQDSGTTDAAGADAAGADAAEADAAPAATLTKSLAPSVASPMYQGGQTRFRTQTGTNCDGRVAASMGAGGFCYLAANDDVKCAGQIGATSYGSSFTATGQTGASQLMVMFDDEGMCIVKADHTVQCMGTNATALGAASATFTQWSSHTDVAAIASGNWDQLCGITTGGQVFCGGAGFSDPPMNVGATDRTSMWVDTTGAVRLSDSQVLRPGESLTDCQVRGNGLSCIAPNGVFGPSGGTIVMGTRIAGGTVCWIDDDATVSCDTGGTTAQQFASQKALFLAASSFSDSLCAIYNDGAIWCVGSNTNGKLGTGNTAALTTATMVAPPGSARARCD